MILRGLSKLEKLSWPYSKSMGFFECVISPQSALVFSNEQLDRGLKETAVGFGHHHAF